MKKIYLFIFVASMAFISSCDKKDDPTPVNNNPHFNDLTTGSWVIDDVIMHTKFESGFDMDNDENLDFPFAIDTTYSIFADYGACGKDLNFNFTSSNKLEYAAGATYCGPLLKKTDYTWQEKENFEKLLVIGKDAGGMFYQDEMVNSLGDTLSLDVKELTNSTFIAVNNYPLEKMYAAAGYDAETIALMKEMGFSFSGSMEITYKWKKQ